MDNTGRASIIFEVVERVEDATNDLQAMHVHLKDIVDTKDRLNFWWEKPITMTKLGYVSTLPITACHVLNYAPRRYDTPYFILQML